MRDVKAIVADIWFLIHVCERGQEWIWGRSRRASISAFRINASHHVLSLVTPPAVPFHAAGFHVVLFIPLRF